MELKRNIDPVLLAEYGKPMFHPVSLVYMDHPDGPVHLHSGVGDLTHDGAVWLGVGKLGSIEIPFEASGAVPEQATLGIVGFVADLIGEAGDQALRGRQVDIYAGARTAAGGVVLVGVPDRVFTGSMGKSDFGLDTTRQVARLSVRIKSGQPARSGAQIAHSDEDQQAQYPGDTLFVRTNNAEQWARRPQTWPET